MSRTERTSLSQPSDWMAAFRAAAERKGLTLNQWIGECCKARLPKSTVAKLSDRPPAHRPRLTANDVSDAKGAE